MVNDNNYSKKDKTKEMRMAEFNAWKALANSNFGQFGFWAEVWANLNITSSVKMKDPFSIINDFAKKKLLKT